MMVMMPWMRSSVLSIAALDGPSRREGEELVRAVHGVATLGDAIRATEPFDARVARIARLVHASKLPRMHVAMLAHHAHVDGLHRVAPRRVVVGVVLCKLLFLPLVALGIVGCLGATVRLPPMLLMVMLLEAATVCSYRAVQPHYPESAMQAIPRLLRRIAER